MPCPFEPPGYHYPNYNYWLLLLHIHSARLCIIRISTNSLTEVQYQNLPLKSLYNMSEVTGPVFCVHQTGRLLRGEHETEAVFLL